MLRMWRNRETNKTEMLAALCLLFAIGGIMLAGFGTKPDNGAAGTFEDWSRRLTDVWAQVEYLEGERLQPTPQGQGHATSQMPEQTIQGESEQTRTEEGDTAITPVTKGTVVVQPGDSLWKIAEACLGDGGQYIEIYEKNRELIGDDPRFILPGMKLNLDGLEK